jgi:putative ABC transport system ATP-binding protein
MRRDDIGFVFQSYNLIDNLTVEENILVPALLSGKKRKDIEARLEELLKAVGLYEHRKHRPMELSGGQQQRTAIARALINSPKVIFADEPIGNLDSQNGKEVLELLSKLNKQYGITILMVTHAEESTQYGNRVIRLKDGQLV